jgi:hypothetical protein
MIERLYPGVYVTEVPFNAKPIAGVPTSTESLYPGVFVNEVPFNARPIEGVSTTTASLSALPSAPAWTDHNQGDPGVTLVELFSWTAESLLYRAGPVGDEFRRARVLQQPTCPC